MKAAAVRSRAAQIHASNNLPLHEVAMGSGRSRGAEQTTSSARKRELTPGGSAIASYETRRRRDVTNRHKVARLLRAAVQTFGTGAATNGASIAAHTSALAGDDADLTGFATVCCLALFVPVAALPTSTLLLENATSPLGRRAGTAQISGTATTLPFQSVAAGRAQTPMKPTPTRARAGDGGVEHCGAPQQEAYNGRVVAVDDQLWAGEAGW
eukprot:6068257-Prymnesium_polylepis.2